MVMTADYWQVAPNNEQLALLYTLVLSQAQLQSACSFSWWLVLYISTDTSFPLTTM
jgi:hypothetical protein